MRNIGYLYRLFFGLCLYLVTAYSVVEAHGGGGGFHGGGGGGFHGGNRSYNGGGFQHMQPGPGPYRSVGYQAPQYHVNNFNQPHTSNQSHASNFNNSQSIHAANPSAQHAQANNAFHQPPNMPQGAHAFPQGQHPQQPQQWHHSNFNQNWANHPYAYNGHWANGSGGRWYNGYWHNYWGDQNWGWWGGNYGFWLGLAAGEVFVYEASPGVCQYWDGTQWAPWYDPPLTPYQCPY